MLAEKKVQQSTEIFKQKPGVFLENIYGNELGQMRAEQLIADLEEVLKNRAVSTILDIGAGHAPVTLTLLARHPHLNGILVEPSDGLLKKAQETAEQLGVAKERITLINAGIEDFAPAQDCELIICHAVVNWTNDPFGCITKLTSLCKEGTIVSLLFGASTGKAIRFAHQGNISDAITTIKTPGEPVGSLLESEKVRPLDPDAVVKFIENLGNTVSFRAGVRIFADYVKPELLKDKKMLEQVKEAESLARTSETYWRLGQLVHVVYGR